MKSTDQKAVTVHVDAVKFEAEATKGGSYKNRGGEVVASYLENIASLFNNLCADAMIKEDLNKKWKGIIRIDGGLTDQYNPEYWHCSITGDGDLFVEHRQFWSNVSDLGSKGGPGFKSTRAALDAIPDPASLADYKVPMGVRNQDGNLALPVTIRIGYRDNKDKFIKSLARISTATGKQAMMNIDFVAWTKFVSAQASYKGRDAEILCDYVDKIATLFENFCKDAMSKEALVEVFNGQIKVATAASEEFKPEYHRFSLTEGVFLLEMRSFWTNVSEISSGLKKLEALL